MAGGAAITGALPDVMQTQWRVELTALAGCGWRSPSLGADVWQAPAGGRPSLLIMYTSILGAHAAQVVGPGARAVGELIVAVCKGHGRELCITKGRKQAHGRLET